MLNFMQLLIVTENFTSHVMLETHENTYHVPRITYNILRVTLRSSNFFSFLFIFALIYCFKSLAFLYSLATSLDQNRRWQRTQNQFKTLIVKYVVQFVIGFNIKDF